MQTSRPGLLSKCACSWQKYDNSLVEFWSTLAVRSCKTNEWILLASHLSDFPRTGWWKTFITNVPSVTSVLCLIALWVQWSGTVGYVLVDATRKEVGVPWLWNRITNPHTEVWQTSIRRWASHRWLRRELSSISICFSSFAVCNSTSENTPTVLGKQWGNVTTMSVVFESFREMSITLGNVKCSPLRNCLKMSTTTGSVTSIAQESVTALRIALGYVTTMSLALENVAMRSPVACVKYGECCHQELY